MTDLRIRAALTEDQFGELLGIVDRRAGRAHSRDGSVARALREVLDRYEAMRQEGSAVSG